MQLLRELLRLEIIIMASSYELYNKGGHTGEPRRVQEERGPSGRADADGKTDWQMSEDDAPRGARDAKEQEDE